MEPVARPEGLNRDHSETVIWATYFPALFRAATKRVENFAIQNGLPVPKFVEIIRKASNRDLFVAQWRRKMTYGGLQRWKDEQIELLKSED